MKNFVEFYFPGISVAGQKEREVSSRQIELAGLIPDGAISYRFFDKDKEGKNMNYSPYHFVGTEYSSEEFKQKYPQLQDNYELSTAHRIVKAVTGGFYPLSDEDIVVSA